MAEGGVVDQLFEGGRECRRGAIDEEASLTVAENLGDSADAGRDDGPCGSHGFDKDEREGLVLGEDDDDVETGEAVSLAAATAIVDLMAGRRPVHVANPDVLAAPQARVRVSA